MGAGVGVAADIAAGFDADIEFGVSLDAGVGAEAHADTMMQDRSIIECALNFIL
jgi:hypothetical protein